MLNITRSIKVGKIETFTYNDCSISVGAEMKSRSHLALLFRFQNMRNGWRRCVGEITKHNYR